MVDTAELSNSLSNLRLARSSFGNGESPSFAAKDIVEAPELSALGGASAFLAKDGSRNSPQNTPNQFGVVGRLLDAFAGEADVSPICLEFDVKETAKAAADAKKAPGSQVKKAQQAMKKVSQ